MTAKLHTAWVTVIQRLCPSWICFNDVPLVLLCAERTYKFRFTVPCAFSTLANSDTPASVSQTEQVKGPLVLCMELSDKIRRVRVAAGRANG